MQDGKGDMIHPSIADPTGTVSTSPLLSGGNITADLEVLVRELHRASAESASAWDLLRLFNENNFPPSLAQSVISATHRQLARLGADQAIHLGHHRGISDGQLTEQELRQILDLVAQEAHGVTLLSAAHDDPRREPQQQNKLASIERDSAINEAAANYLSFRRDHAKAMAFTMAQNNVRARNGLPLFDLGVFASDVREFLDERHPGRPTADPFFVHDAMAAIAQLSKGQ